VCSSDLPTDLALALDYRISHILVDEFQDTSLGQYRLLQTLMEAWHEGDGNSFFAVGDPMQSVYRFRDADVRLYQETFARGIGQVSLRGLHLTSNFRSRAGLVDWCNATFGALFGTDNIDVDTCTSLDIPVTFVPDYGYEEVADHAMALLMAQARGISVLDRSVRSGEWTNQPARPMHRMRGRVLGILGYGRIGYALAQRAIPHGLKILVHDPYITADRVADIGAELVDKDRLVTESDFISVHAPLTPETHHTIGEPELRAMKPTTYLINTARGPLIDEYALARAIDAGWIAGAGIDVLEQEPPPPNHPLIGLERAVVTPHAAFLSEESLLELERRAALSVVRVLQGRMPEYVWNREVLERVSLTEE